MRRFEASPRRATPKGQNLHQLHSTAIPWTHLHTQAPAFVAHLPSTLGASKHQVTALLLAKAWEGRRAFPGMATPLTRTIEETREVTSSYSVPPTYLHVVIHGVAQQSVSYTHLTLPTNRE